PRARRPAVPRHRRRGSEDRWLDVIRDVGDEPDPGRQRALWEEALELSPRPMRRSLSLTQLGVLDVREGAADPGRAPFEEARRIAPGMPSAYLKAGEGLLDAGDAASAEPWLRGGVEALLDDDPDLQLKDMLALWDRALEATGRDGGELREAADE